MSWARRSPGGPDLHTATEGARTGQALPEAHASRVTGSRVWRMLRKTLVSWRDSRPCHGSPNRCCAGPWAKHVLCTESLILTRARCGPLVALFGGGGD